MIEMKEVQESKFKITDLRTISQLVSMRPTATMVPANPEAWKDSFPGFPEVWSHSRVSDALYILRTIPPSCLNAKSSVSLLLAIKSILLNKCKHSCTRNYSWKLALGNIKSLQEENNFTSDSTACLFKTSY